MNHHPIAFMSYVRLDDEHEDGRLSDLIKRLSGEVRMQSGIEFKIFQDRNDIKWGQEWQARVENSLDSATFLIPIITPSFFKSVSCRKELERFLDNAANLKRKDLILPLYYVDCPHINDMAHPETVQLAKVIFDHQCIDWRDMRFEPITTPAICKLLAKMAKMIILAIDRGKVASSDIDAAKAIAIQADRRDRALATRTHENTKLPTIRGLSHKFEPPTHVVDSMLDGNFASVSEALQAAKPGDRILVRPGVYRESLVIDKQVTIIGDGMVDKIIIIGKLKDTILFRADMGRIANLTLRQEGRGTWHCVDIDQGRLRLEDCDISSSSLACVAIHNNADPLLLRNRIHNGKEGGVFIFEDGKGTLEENEIFFNQLSGVEICDNSNPTLRRNVIRDGSAAGILVHKHGRGRLEDNEIATNVFAGVTIRNKGNADLYRNKITGNGCSGVSVSDGGQGHFEDNDLRGNAQGAWDISTECRNNCVKKNNQV